MSGIKKHIISAVLGLALGIVSFAPALAFQKPAPHNPVINRVVLRLNANVFTAQAILRHPDLQVRYQWRVGVKGHWRIFEKYGTNSTFTWTPSFMPSGTYQIDAVVLTASQVSHHQWQDGVVSNPESYTPSQPPTAITTLTLTGPPGPIAVGEPWLLAVGANVDGTPVALPTETPSWLVTPYGAILRPGTGIIDDMAAFEAALPGYYTITVTLDGLTASTVIIVE